MIVYRHEEPKPRTTEAWCKYVMRFKGDYSEGLDVTVEENGKVYFLGYVDEVDDIRSVIYLTEPMARRYGLDLEKVKKAAMKRKVVST